MIDLVRRGQSSVYGQVSVRLLGETRTNLFDYTQAQESSSLTIIENGFRITNNYATETGIPIKTFLKPNTTYTIKADCKIIQGEPIMSFGLISGIDLKSSGNGFTIMPYAGGGYVERVNTFTTKGSLEDVGLYFYGIANNGIVEFTNIIIEEGNTVGNYISYGTKSTNSVRLRSVGKNLCPTSQEAWKQGLLSSGDGKYSASNVNIHTPGYYLIPQGKISCSQKDKTLYVFFYDENKNYISFAFGPNITVPVNAKYARFRIISSVDITPSMVTTFEPQCEQGTTATEYEPYKESTAVINLTEPLRSVPSAKDEYSVTTGVLTQRIGEIISQLEPYPAGDTTNYKAYKVLIPPVGIDPNSATYTRNLFFNGKFIGRVAQSIFVEADSDNIYRNDGTYVYVKLPNTVDPTGIEYTLTYQLAEPVVTQLEPIPITIFPNGTQYIEFGTKEVAEYADGIAITNTTIPIKTMVKVDKLHIENGHWKRTNIPLTSVTVAGDGLSFTITGAVNGDTYEYSYDYDSALSTMPDLDVGEPSLVTRNNRTIVL